MTTSLFASFLSKIGPRVAAKAKTSPNSRAAAELWKRLFGDAATTEEELTEEQLQVWNEAVVAAKVGAAEAPVAVAPVASPAARQQLSAFVRETNLRSNRSMATTTTSTAVNNPFTTTPTQASPPPPPMEDLRIPVRMGDPNSNMVHLAQ